jgi:hypothetical protein
MLLDVAGEKPAEAWRNRNLVNHFSNAVVFDGLACGSNGHYEKCDFACIDLEKGETLWATSFKDDPESPTQEQARVILADGKLIILTAYGELVLAEATGEAFNELGRFRLKESNFKFWSHPALSDGRFYCQDTGGEIFCVDLRVAD